MTNAKYWIYGGRRWREVDTDTGRVDGWGDVSFIFMSRGKLMKGNKLKILRALRKLGTGDRTGAARDGPRLSEKRAFTKVAHPKRTRSCNCHHFCPAANKCAIISVQEKPDLPELTSPKTITANASAQTESNALNIITRVENNSERSRHSKRKHVISSDKTTSHDEDDNEPKTVNYNRIITLHSDDGSAKEQPKSNKVLDIDEKDIMMLRACIEKGMLFPDADLLKFDSSDEYKRSLLYQLNPLVYVDRSKKIAEMLKAKNSTEILNLEQFLSTLGLRHVKYVKKPKRYRTRNTISQTRGDTKDNDSQSLIDDNDKENHATKKLRKKNLSLKRKEVEIPIASNGVNKPLSSNGVTKALENNRLTEVYDENMLRNRLKVPNGVAKITSDSSDSSERPYPQSERLKITNLRENNLSKVPNRLEVVNSKTVISESDESSFEETSSREEAKQDVPNKVKTQKKIKVNKPSVSVPKRADPMSRAYTPAEDRAIVDWVLGGSRARKVNGNSLWRQLEPAYFEITGHARSWHSLRNRYLRNIMPSLQTIAPLHASKLRAAAAAGEIKTKNHRHSMFSPPKIGAASRRHPAAKESSPTPRKLRSSPEGPTLRPLRSTQSLGETGIQQSIHKLLNQSLNRSPHKLLNRSPHKLRDQLANRSPHKSPNRLTRRSLRNVTIDSDNSDEPLKEVSGEQKNLKRRKLYNP